MVYGNCVAERKLRSGSSGLDTLIIFFVLYLVLYAIGLRV